jgi:hypothetical protein
MQTLKEFRASQEKGFEAASLVHQDKNTGNVFVLIDDTSLEKGDLVVEVRRYSFDGTRWNMAMLYANNDYQCAMVKFNECLNSCVVVTLDGLQFKCPSCGGHRLECCENGPYNSEVLCIDDECDFEWGEISASGDVDRFQCLGCGFVLEHDNYPITDHEEVVEWIKENCK